MSENEEHIRRRAYEIWEQEGKPQGEDLNHWVCALQEIGAKAESQPGKAAAPAKKAKTTKKTAEKPATPPPAATGAAPAKTAKAKATTSATRH